MYRFYLDDILLPVTPSELSVKVGDKNETIELLNDKDLILLKNPALSEISFSILLPAQNVPYAVYENNKFIEAGEIIKKIQKLKDDKKKFLFSVIRRIGDKTYFDSMIKVVLSDYDTKESADEGFDLIMNINLKEYKEASTQVGKITQDEKGNPIIQYEKVVDDSFLPPQIIGDDLNITGIAHTVKNGTETLWKIAKQKLGDGSRYNEFKALEEWTGQDWTDNNGPNYLKVGQQFILNNVINPVKDSLNSLVINPLNQIKTSLGTKGG